MCGLLTWLLLSVSLANSLPCCQDNMPMIPLQGLVKCQDFTNISVYAWCSSFFANDPDDALSYGELFHENEDRTEYTFDGHEWFHTYCTGPIMNNSLSKGHHLFDKQGKEVAMTCPHEADQAEEDHYLMYATCLLISCVFLLLTVLIYLVLPELRDLQGKCVLCFILSLMFGYLCLVYLQMPFTSPDVENSTCIVIAFLTYFWMMSAFFWLNINSFNMWRSAVLAHISMSEQRLMHAYYLAGWGFPVLALIIALITHHLPGDHILRPNFGVRSCWFKGKLELWSFFYGPVLVLLILNIIYFIWTALHLWSDYRSPNPMPRVKSLRIKFCLYLKLFIVMGITWIFEILSSIDNEPWYLTDILNCFQGVIIFIVMILLRKRVWRLLAAKKFCGMHFANCWERMNDDEETINEAVDETQMSAHTTANNKA